MLLNATKQSLNQIISIIEQLDNLAKIKQQYLYCELNIGKHIRHINDHFFALKQGINTGIIDYNNRNRGTKIETQSCVALSQLQQLIAWLEHNEHELSIAEMNKSIKVFSEIDCLHTQSMEFSSTVGREMLFLINHTIHHAAHIALIAKNQGVDIPLNTGMAPSTMNFLKASNT